MKKTSFLILTLMLFLQGFAQEQQQDAILSEWNAMQQTKTARFEEYNELKFGMFIHWGVYSKLGGIYKGEKIVAETHGHQATIGEWIMYCARIPRAEYLDIAAAFNPTGFNAGEWVKLAKEAGMRYIVAMPKHHDGFAMYHSRVSPYNIYDHTPFRRDPMQELYDACRKHGIRMGIYYSHSIDWMDGGDAGIAQAKAANPQLKDTLAANTWDPAPVSYRDYIENKAKPQMRELLTQFPGLVEIWYDFPRYMNRQQSFEFYKLAYDYQPECLINSRVGNDLGDVLTAGDNQIPVNIDTRYKTWETPGTLNNTWGYKSYDHDWKSVDEVLFWIVEIASKGGNYLLNVGPDGNGVIPAPSVAVLKGIGKWMKINGEAIYGTRSWTTLKEGPTALVMKSTTHRKEEGFNTVFTREDFWFTRKDNTVYAICLADPGDQPLTIASLHGCRDRIESIDLVGGKKNLTWTTRGDKIAVSVPRLNRPDAPGFALRINLKKSGE